MVESICIKHFSDIRRRSEGPQLSWKSLTVDVLYTSLIGCTRYWNFPTK